MKIFETIKARFIILFLNLIAIGFFIGQGNLLFIINIIGVIPLLCWVFTLEITNNYEQNTKTNI